MQKHNKPEYIPFEETGLEMEKNKAFILILVVSEMASGSIEVTTYTKIIEHDIDKIDNFIDNNYDYWINTTEGNVISIKLVILNDYISFTNYIHNEKIVPMFNRYNN
jgi:hypothetical protein